MIARPEVLRGRAPWMPGSVPAERLATDIVAALPAGLTRLTTDSREAGAGTCFLAYPGTTRDGRDYIASAIAGGTRAVLWEPAGFVWDPHWTVPNAPVAGLRSQAGRIAAAFYGDPSGTMRVVGVTGTNGKTTCTWAIQNGLERYGIRTALVGTLGTGFAGALSSPANTTPDAVRLHERLAEFRDQGGAAVAMEVSSHGLDQGRVNGVRFDIAVFTNLSRDHLDYHGDMAAYAEAKAKLFAAPGLRCAICNLDDELGRGLVRRLAGRGIEVVGYGIEALVPGPDVVIRARHVEETADGLAFEVVSPWGEATLRSRMVGRFNVYNLLSAVAVFCCSGIPFPRAVELAAAVDPPPGRMQRIGGGTQPLVVVDYAHSPDALEKVLTSLRPLVEPGCRLWCVFGCGGDRDRGKRPLMGAAAVRLADRVVVTSDNPRSEDAHAIAVDIEHGMGGVDHDVLLDRRIAIAHALTAARSGDVVLIAGKGHESWQEIAGERLPFSDFDVARTLLGPEALP